jgi:hypothetical protein
MSVGRRTLVEVLFSVNAPGRQRLLPDILRRFLCRRSLTPGVLRRLYAAKNSRTFTTRLSKSQCSY